MAKAIGPRRINGLLGSTALRDLVRRARHIPNSDNEPNPDNGPNSNSGAPTDASFSDPGSSDPGSKQALANHLPPALRNRVHLVLEQGRLLMLAENNAVAQLLRFQGPALARRCGARDWRVRVSPLPASGQAPAPDRTPAPMPAAAAAALREAATGVDDDALGEALRRLAANADDGGDRSGS